MFHSSASNFGHRGETLRLLQLTDTHLYAGQDGRLLGQNTRRTLELVFDLASRNPQPVDLILLTGDLVHDESVEGYNYLQRRLTALGTPYCCLPGNHDNAPLVARTFNTSAGYIEETLSGSSWNLVLLNSAIPDEDGGHLDKEQLEWLDESLSSRPKDTALVCLHHQPVPVGSAWIDTMALDNSDDFFKIIDRHPQVRGVTWGHVHQEYSSLRKGVRLLGSPSTCIQFLPGSKDFALDSRPPGLRWLDLHPNGRIRTLVERIASYPDPLIMSTGGY